MWTRTRGAPFRPVTPSRMPHFLQQRRDSRRCLDVAECGVQHLQKPAAKRSHMRRPTVPLVTLVIFVVIVAACSSAPKSPGVARQGPASTNGAPANGPQSSGALAEMMAYSRCMRSHGISDFPDPTPNPGGPGGSSARPGTARTTISTTTTPGTRPPTRPASSCCPTGDRYRRLRANYSPRKFAWQPACATTACRPSRTLTTLTALSTSAVSTEARPNTRLHSPVVSP